MQTRPETRDINEHQQISKVKMTAVSETSTFQPKLHLFLTRQVSLLPSLMLPSEARVVRCIADAAAFSYNERAFAGLRCMWGNWQSATSGPLASAECTKLRI